MVSLGIDISATLCPTSVAPGLVQVQPLCHLGHGLEIAGMNSWAISNRVSFCYLKAEFEPQLSKRPGRSLLVALPCFAESESRSSWSGSRHKTSIRRLHRHGRLGTYARALGREFRCWWSSAKSCLQSWRLTILGLSEDAHCVALLA